MMGEFAVDISKARSNAGEIKKVCQSIQTIDRSLTGIKSNLAVRAEVGEALKKQLEAIHRKLLEEAVKANSLSEALVQVAQLYEATEKQIVGNGEGGKTALSGASGGISEDSKEGGWWSEKWNDLKKWLVECRIIDAEEQKRTAGEAVSEHQQKEQDIYMQNRIQELNKTDRFSKKTWKKASTDERMQILNEYIVQVAAVMGLSIDHIDFFDAQANNGMATRGYYSDSDNSVHINRWVIENGDDNGFPSYKLFSTVVHELRHAYQYAACENPDNFVVTEETITKWRTSFHTYKSTDDFEDEGMNSTEAYQAYKNQEVEKDARRFAKQD